MNLRSLLGSGGFLLTCLIDLVVSMKGRYSNCQCFIPPHPQGDYCHSSFAVRGLVQDMRIVPKDNTDPYPSMNEPDIYHTIRIQEDFKSIPSQYLSWFGNDRSFTLETFTSSIMCGVGYLNVQEQYLLTGQIFNGRFTMSSCDTHVLWNSLNETTKQKWREGFDCDDCMVRSTNQTADPQDICVLSDNLTYYNSLVCLRNEEHICQWVEESL